MHIIAIKQLPQGQTPGTLVDLPASAAQLFIDIGAARAATAEECGSAPAPSASAAAATNVRRRGYQRRDMHADA